MGKKSEILLLLTDKWCDWKGSYVIAVANAFSDYVVKTISVDKIPKVPMGNLSTSVDYCITDYNNFTNSEALGVER